MRFVDLLEHGRVRVPLEGRTVEEALRELSPEQAPLGPGAGVGRFRRVTPSSLLVVVRAGPPGDPWASLGVSPSPLRGEAEDAGEGAAPRIVVLVHLPGATRGGAGTGSLPAVVRALQDPGVESRLLEAANADELRAVRRLMEAELVESLRVEHALIPLTYRVYPDTPLIEIVDLMARKGLQAVPVVGPDMQVLGMVSSGEALRHVVGRRGRGREGGGEPGSDATARDVMSRSVLCVAADQDLHEAAQTMVQKETGHLPVIRDGEIVGILTRDAVLGALLGEL